MTLVDAGISLAAVAGPHLIAWSALRSSRTRERELSAHLVALAALIALTMACAVKADLQIHAPTVMTPVLGCAMAALIILALGPALMKLPALVGPSGHDQGLARLARLPLWSVFLAVMVGAVSEELLYRAIAWPLLAGPLGPVYAALTVSLAFGLAHWPMWGQESALGTGLAGLAFTAAYAAHGDIYANILAHIIADCAGLVWPRLRHSSPGRNAGPR